LESLTGFNFDPAIEEAVWIACIMIFLTIGSAIRKTFWGKTPMSTTGENASANKYTPLDHNSAASGMNVHPRGGANKSLRTAQLQMQKQAHLQQQQQQQRMLLQLQWQSQFPQQKLQEREQQEDEHKQPGAAAEVLMKVCSNQQPRCALPPQMGGKFPCVPRNLNTAHFHSRGHAAAAANNTNHNKIADAHRINGGTYNAPSQGTMLSRQYTNNKTSTTNNWGGGPLTSAHTWAEGEVVHHRPPLDKAGDVGVPTIKGQKTLLIAYYPWEAREDDVFLVFSKVAVVKRVRLIVDRDSRRPKCYGFVKFASSDDAERALLSTIKGLVQLKDMRGHIWHVKGEWAWSGEMMVDDGERSCSGGGNVTVSPKKMRRSSYVTNRSRRGGMQSGSTDDSTPSHQKSDAYDSYTTIMK